MWKAAKQLLANNDKLDLALMGVGTTALLRGRKLFALSTFGLGAYGLELVYRERNDFDGTMAERWERALAFYGESHAHPVNREFHKWGIPVIVGSTLGLIVLRPGSAAWKASLAGFVLGWGSNFVGHAIERSAPALVDDPLSFLAGPVSDFMWMTQGEADAATESSEDATVRAAA